ncbi:DUF5954 family protein [Actinomadura rupiterrae]|uniref:DUF5954 family protein n=1 Tax=Actinomadura rupiterrae TaxID=559627 RepID=UPI0020A45A2A|nr:DUF5954 family protein [Actinomadura rupiterrae]MCP2340424.1 hypothetical protein [Actinomadura rupiterrae]
MKAFPLMRGYDTINVRADLEPMAAMRDAELGERIRAFPKMLPGGSPDFAVAEQVGDEWRLLCSGANDPASARIDLASKLRCSAEPESEAEADVEPEAESEAESEADPAPFLPDGVEGVTGVRREVDPGTARAMLAAAGRLDPEEGEPLAKDEWEIGDRRYRIVRIEKFVLINSDGMEPPRSSDAEPPDEVSLLAGHPIDPGAPAGFWEAQMRLNLVGFGPLSGSVPEQVEAEARLASRTHPGVVMLPPTFSIVEVTAEGAWKPLTGGHGPDSAKERLSGHFVQLLPMLREFQGEPASEDELADWASAAKEIDAEPGPEWKLTIGGEPRRFRIVRIGRMLRVGPDGPEAPRPSDQDRYGIRPPREA